MNELKVQDFRQKMRNEGLDSVLDSIHTNEQVIRAFEKQKIEIDIHVENIKKENKLLRELVTDMELERTMELWEKCAEEVRNIEFMDFKAKEHKTVKLNVKIGKPITVSENEIRIPITGDGCKLFITATKNGDGTWNLKEKQKIN